MEKAKRYTAGQQMKENWKLTMSSEKCNHNENCGCVMTLEGISSKTIGIKYQATPGPLSTQWVEAAAFMETAIGGDFTPDVIDTEMAFVSASLKKNSTVQVIEKPVEKSFGWPGSASLFPVDPRVLAALKRSDLRYFQTRFPHLNLTWTDMSYRVWSPDDRADCEHTIRYKSGEAMKPCECVRPLEVPSLFDLSLRQQSAYHWALGRTNRRMHVVAAMANLFPRKYAKAVLSVAREPVGDRPREPMQYLEEALDHMYRMMRVPREEKEVVKVSLKSLKGMYLGSSNGFSDGRSYVIPESGEFPYPVSVNPRGKKIDTFEQDLMAVLDFIRLGKEPPVYWTHSPKNENFFHFVKQLSDDEYAKWEQKLRIFVIPNSIYILLEKIASHSRHMKERGWVIRVGHCWSKGGADTMAKCLGVDLSNCWLPELVEGDAKNFDQTVLEMFVNLYFSTMLSGFDQSSEDYPVMERIIKFLLKNMIMRVTRYFGDLWATVKGGVPSGAFNTSHMDSWIMALYFCLFCVYQVHAAPLEVQEKLEEEFIRIIRLVVYGDDHLYRKGRGLGAIYFSGVAFASFMKRHFGVEIRDLCDGLPFCSKTKDGWITEMGATMLKHQFVLNPYVDQPGQSVFLPFRESREFLVRAIWGRETKYRDNIDVMMSIIGHAYGTYASNRDAYDRLKLLYVELLSDLDDLQNLSQTMLSRMSREDLRRMRQMAVGPELFASGFPTWESLVEKNIYDASYQDTTLRHLDLEDDLEVY